jgi:hypothetical protein
VLGSRLLLPGQLVREFLLTEALFLALPEGMGAGIEERLCSGGINSVALTWLFG